tara:strand:- start:152 stop:355 length:204 start_codon:yes stop_codon:yes gene_type:complete
MAGKIKIWGMSGKPTIWSKSSTKKKKPNALKKIKTEEVTTETAEADEKEEKTTFMKRIRRKVSKSRE